VPRRIKTIYIAKKLDEVKYDEYGNQIPQYSKPKSYEINVQPISSNADIQMYGESATTIQKAVIDYDKYYGEFKEFDIAYLDGATPKGEKVNGANANYRLNPPRNQNKRIVIYFERLKGK